MRGNKNVVLALAVMLALSIVLPACGNGKGAANSNSTATSNGSEASASTTSDAGAGTQPPAASTAVEYWGGQLDSGDTFLWMDDGTTQTARILLLETHGEEETITALEGPVTTSDDFTEITVTDNETQATFGFKVTSVTDTSMEIDAGEHGKGQLSLIGAEEFDAATGAYFAYVEDDAGNTNQEPEQAPEDAPNENGEPNNENGED